MIRVLIVGAGDVARRLYPLLAGRCRVIVLARVAGRSSDPFAAPSADTTRHVDTTPRVDTTRADNARWWRDQGAGVVAADLDRRASLTRLHGLAQWVIHLAPPPAAGEGDPRTRNLLAALARGGRVPQRLIYISTTGVYGDLQGAAADETTPRRRAADLSQRARRRLDAERRLRDFARRTGCQVSILRVPGIYAGDRLPLDRLKSGSASLRAEDDVYTNHIHADDLARAIVAALRRGRCNRTYNVIDDSDLKMGDYFDAVADAFALPRPPRLPAAAARQAVSAAMWSYMAESRRLSSRRLKKELGLELRHPTVRGFLRQMTNT